MERLLNLHVESCLEKCFLVGAWCWKWIEREREKKKRLKVDRWWRKSLRMGVEIGQVMPLCEL